VDSNAGGDRVGVDGGGVSETGGEDPPSLGGYASPPPDDPEVQMGLQEAHSTSQASGQNLGQTCSRL